MADARDILSVDYKDEHFNFEVEARWAVFFDSIGIEWHYKPVLVLDPKDLYPYRPTFFLPNAYLRSDSKQGILMEVSTYRQGNIDHHELLQKTAEKLGYNAIVANQFRFDIFDGQPEDMYQVTSWWDNNMMIYRCNCGAVKFEFQESNYMHCHHEWCKRAEYDLMPHYEYARLYKFNKVSALV